MSGVDFDQRAAARAIAACRDASDELRGRARQLPSEVGAVRWEGGARRRADAAVTRLVARLHRRAAAVDATAEAIAIAMLLARAEEARLAELARRRAQCAPVSGPVPPPPPSPPSPTVDSPSAPSAPVGVR